MSILMQLNPFDYFADMMGDALDEGYIWIGQPNKNPQSFPVTVYLDAALTIPAAQPLRTNAGYIVRGNSPTFLYINGNYSVLVEDKKHRQVYYIADFLLTGNSGAVSQDDLSNTTDPYKGAGIVGRMPLIIENVTELRATPGRRQFDRCILMNYNGNDTKARGRYLTWVPGASSDDGGMKFAATGGYWISDLDENSRVSAEFYGLPVGASQNSHDKLEAMMIYCAANKVDAFIGPGPESADPVYDTFEQSFPLSGPRSAGLPLTAFNFSVFSTPQVTFQTTSSGGADVFNICSLSDWALFGFPQIKGFLTSQGGSGSNGVSMVFGGKNITIEATVDSMPMIWRAGGGSDGGHGFTIQFGTGNTNPYENVKIRGRVKNCTSAFNFDFSPSNTILYPDSSIDLEIFGDDCYRGVTIGGTTPSSTIVDPRVPQPVAAISGNVFLKNCQQSVLDLRSWGTGLDVEILNTKEKADLIKNPNDSLVEVARILGSKHGNLRINARVLSVDKVATVGGVSMGGNAFPSLEYFTLNMKVRYTAATTEFDIGDTSVAPLRNSTAYLDGFSAIPNAFASTSLSSSITINGGSVNPTLYPGDESVQAPGGGISQVIYRGALTGSRIVTAPGSANRGDQIIVVRTAASTGGIVSAFSVTVAAGARATFVYDGTTWGQVP